jgi:hypothetical protein
MVTFKFRGEHFFFKQKTFGIGIVDHISQNTSAGLGGKTSGIRGSFCQRNKVAARFL